MIRRVIISMFVAGASAGCDRGTAAPAPAAPTVTRLLLDDLRSDRRDDLHRATSFLRSHCPEFDPPAVTEETLFGFKVYGAAGVSLAEYQKLGAAWDEWVTAQRVERLDALEAIYQEHAMLWSPQFGLELTTTPAP